MEQQDSEDHEVTMETYDTRPGASGAGGHFYEIKLSLLFFLRLQSCDEFYLAKNMANVGAFDDVVFKRRSGREAKLVFLQAKHSDNPEEGHITIDDLLSPKGQFSLKKYLYSYQTIKRNFEKALTPLFRGININNCSFIIFSNNILETNAERWIEITGDEIVVGKGGKSHQLNPDASINRDIINKLSCNKLHEIALEIYNYTLGGKSKTGIKVSNGLLKKYHIVLANKVFAVNKQKPCESKFSTKFHETRGLWEEFSQIAGNPVNETFKERLKTETVNLYKQFGKHENKLEGESRKNLIDAMVNIIKPSTSYHIKISEPPEDINKLANHVLVGVEEEGSKNIVKFCDSEPSDDANRFMNDLKSKLQQTETAITDLDIMKIRFQIEEFPILSLPRPDEVVTEDEVKDFLAKLEFVLGQENENQLDVTIQNEIQETCKVKDEEEKMAIFVSVKSKIESWWKAKHGNTGSFLKKDTKFVEDAQTGISHFILKPFQDFGKQGIHNTAVQFDNTVLDELMNIILRQKVLHIIAENGTSLLSSVKVCQTLDRENEGKNYNFIQVHHLLNIQDHVLQVFQSKEETPYFLVIESNSELLDCAQWANEEDIRSFYDRLFKIIEKSVDKCVILITEIGDVNHFEGKDTFLYEISDNTNLNDLTTESQQLLLNKEVISLQGMTLAINKLIPECNDKLKEEITSKLLINLINNPNMVISNAPQRLSESEAAFTSFYKQMPKENLVKMIKEPVDNTMIVISGMKGSNIELLKNELVKFLGNEDSIETHVNERIADETIIIPYQNSAFHLREFKQICAKNSAKTIYWVDVSLGSLHLQQVYHPYFYLKREFRRYKKFVLRPEILCQEKSPEMLIFRTTNDKKKVKKLIAELEGKCMSHFNKHCDTRTIIFKEFSKDASAIYEELKTKNDSVHWVQIVSDSKLKWHKSNATRPKMPKWNPVFESDLFIGESNPHVFIFSNLSDKREVTTMIERSCSKRRSLFEQNCGKIILFSEKITTIAEVEKTTHWLKVDNEQLTWEQTYGPISTLQGFIDRGKCERELYAEDEMSKLVESEVIIADEPGMGKTTSLTSVSQQMLNDHWVIRMNFLDCENAIDTVKESNLTMEDVYNFVSKVESTGLRNDWAKLLMTHKLYRDKQNTFPILFLFDGFDEINENIRLKILPFLQFIKSQTSAILWVTTRFHTMDILENKLSVFAAEFVELGQEDRLKFLNRFWTIRLSPFLKQDNIEQRTEKYSSCLLHQVSHILGDGLSRSLGVPLQLRLLAEVLRQDYVNYMKSGNDNLLKFSHIDVLYVYSHFIREKYEIYIRDKNRLTVNESLKLPIFISFDKKHEMLAFKSLFPDSAIIKPKGLCKDYVDLLKSVGIIQSIGMEGKPHFIHKTFAEYFVAKLLFRCVGKRESNHTKCDNAAKFLNKHIFEESNRVIRNFIHHMSTAPNEDFPIHFATFQNKLKDVIGLMKDTNNCNNCDKFGRTPLHIAAWEGHLNIVKVLLDSGCDAIAQDVLGKTALHYAVMKGHVQVVEHILNYTTDINIFDNIFATPLQVDVKIGDSLFQDPELLHSKLIALTNTEDIGGKAPLHYATEIKDWEIATMLIVHGANVSSQTHETSMEISHYNITNFSYWDEFIVGLFMLRSVVPTNNITRILFQFIQRGHIKVFDAVRGDLTVAQIAETLDRFTNDSGQMEKIRDEDHLKVAKYLLQERDNEFMAKTLAKDAARLGNLETMKYVLAKGYNNDYISYMKCAVEGHNLNIVKHLEGNFKRDKNGNTALHLAADFNSLQIAKYLVENNADVKALNNKKQTPLEIAISFKNRIVEPYLRIKSNSYFDKPQVKSNVTLLLPNQNTITACISIDEIEEYFRKFPKGIDENGATKLHWSAFLGIIDKQKSFLTNFQIKDKNDYTPLHYAVRNDQIEMVKLILFHHVKIVQFNPKSKQGETPLDIAKGQSKEFLQKIHDIFEIFQNGGSNIDSLKSMPSNDFVIAAINCCDEYGNVLLEYAASANDIESVLFILRNGGPFEFKPKEQSSTEVWHLLTPLHKIMNIIAKQRDAFAPLKSIKCLDEYSGIADVRGPFNKNFLHESVSNKVNYYLLSYLVNHGTNINAIDQYNKSVIFSAIDIANIGFDNLDFVKFLLYKGVDIKDLTPDAKQKLFDCADKNGRPDITDLFHTLLEQSEQSP